MTIDEARCRIVDNKLTVCIRHYDKTVRYYLNNHSRWKSDDVFLKYFTIMNKDEDFIDFCIKYLVDNGYNINVNKLKRYNDILDLREKATCE